MKGKLAYLVLFVFTVIAFNALAADHFVIVKLPQNIEVELPKNWTTLSNNQLTTLSASATARVRSVSMLDATSNLKFASTLYDDAGQPQALFNIRYYPQLDLSQYDAKSATTQDIQELDNGLREALEKSGQISGFTILKWFGTSRVIINGTYFFITEYERSPVNNNGNFRVRLIRAFDGNSSFTVTVSYRSDDEYILRPICDYIIESIKSI